MSDYVQSLIDLGYDVLPVGVYDSNGVFNPKNPGIAQNLTWDVDGIVLALDQDSRKGLAIKLSLDSMIDIESDTKEADEYAEKLFRGVETVSWRGIGADSHFPGVHRLFRLTPGQVETLVSAGKKVWPVPGLDVRYHGISVIPPSGGRVWINKPGLLPIATLPDKSFSELTAGFESRIEPSEGATGTPGHKYCMDGPPWEEILEPHGWTLLSGGRVRRPGKSEGVSGTVGVCTSPTRGELLYVFSTSPQIAPFLPGQSYSKFEAYAFLEHAGSFSGASRALRSQGYGGVVDAASVFDVYPETVEAVEVVETVEVVEPVKSPGFLELDEKLMQNVIGDYVLGIKDSFGFDVTAVYFQALEMFGALVGRNAFYEFNSGARYLTDYLIVAGETGAGKGVTFDRAKCLFINDSPDMFSDSGYSTINIGRIGSGEGLIKALMDRDGLEFQGGKQYERCLLCTDQEGVGALKKTFYDGSTIVDALLKAWDFNSLSNTTSAKTLLARNPLVTLIWHITPSSLSLIPPEYFHQGLMNRLKFIHCRKPDDICLPYDSPSDVLKASRERMIEVLEWVGREPRKLSFDTGAKESLWGVSKFQHELQGSVSEAHARYSAHVERMACRLALLDRTDIVSRRHVDVAAGLHKLVFSHTEKLLADFRTVSPGHESQESIRAFLDDNAGQVFTITQIRKQVFSGNGNFTRLQKALAVLVESGQVSTVVHKTKSGSKIAYTNVQ